MLNFLEQNFKAIVDLYIKIYRIKIQTRIDFGFGDGFI